MQVNQLTLVQTVQTVKQAKRLLKTANMADVWISNSLTLDPIRSENKCVTKSPEFQIEHVERRRVKTLNVAIPCTSVTFSFVGPGKSHCCGIILLLLGVFGFLIWYGVSTNKKLLDQRKYPETSTTYWPDSSFVSPPIAIQVCCLT